MTRQELIDHCLTYSDAYEDYPFPEAWTMAQQAQADE